MTSPNGKRREAAFGRRGARWVRLPHMTAFFPEGRPA
jgi:hypothetical protein